jgi:hypothetical protein
MRVSQHAHVHSSASVTLSSVFRFFLFRGVLQCTYISNMDRCKKDLKLTKVSPTNKGRWDSVFRTATRYGPGDPGTESRWGGGGGGRDIPFLSGPSPTNTQPPVKWLSVPSGVGGKTRGGGADQSTAFSAEVANMLEQYLRPVCLQR